MSDTSGLKRGLSPPGTPQRAAQLRNLERGRRHGAGHYAKVRTEPLADQHAAKLREAFPLAPEAMIAAQSVRLAQLDLFAAYAADHGSIQKNGEPKPAAKHLAALTAASDRAMRALERYGPNDRELRAKRIQREYGDAT